MAASADVATDPLGAARCRAALKNTNVREVKYTIEQDSRVEYFAMIDDLLVVQSKLRPGAFRLTIRASAVAAGRQTTSAHSLRVLVMTQREKYPIFDKLSYELKVRLWPKSWRQVAIVCRLRQPPIFPSNCRRSTQR